MRLSVPLEISSDLGRAERLEWWTLAWTGSVVIVMGLAMGSSQAMRTALFEDVLSLLPATVFLVAARFERKGASAKFPYGFYRVNSIAFLVAAGTLTGLGLFLFAHSGMSLVRGEHPTIPPAHLFGTDIWLGWLMILALVYSVIPPVVLGHMKMPLARKLNDKVLYTDALTQKADWTTGLAGIIGILGVGLGFWWADALAAIFIALSVTRDGVNQLKIAAAELADGAPRALDSPDIADDAQALQASLTKHFPEGRPRMRETGRYIVACIEGVHPPADLRPPEYYWPPGVDNSWRLAALEFEP